MRRSRGRVVEVDSLGDFDARLAAGAASLAGWHIQALDLSSRSEELERVDVTGALFLGCRFAPGGEDSVRARGAVVFPEVPGSPVGSFRSGLYTARELYDSADYEDSLDARTYAWSQVPRDRENSLAQALHDHAIDEALASWIAGRTLVGVMGGHALRRDDPRYREAALLGHGLGAGHVVCTGGGPGAMEAANVGAYLAGQDVAAVAAAVELLSDAPSFAPDVGRWVRTAFKVLDEHPTGGDNLGVPTWHYGHEPPNPFATAIAKYFRNSTREATLLAICNAGIVFLPGAAGTVQEVFQDGCENYYADASSVAPMVLVGTRYWTETVPAWPLLQSLARDREMADHVHLVDSVSEAVDLVNG